MARDIITYHKQVDSAAEVQLVTDADVPGNVSELLVRAIKVRALTANAGTVYVGKTGVTTSGAAGGDELSAGEWVSYELVNPSILFARASALAQNVAVTLLIEE